MVKMQGEIVKLLKFCAVQLILMESQINSQQVTQQQPDYCQRVEVKI